MIEQALYLVRDEGNRVQQRPSGATWIVVASEYLKINRRVSQTDSKTQCGQTYTAGASLFLPTVKNKSEIN